jgi:hypothetical protein
MAGTSTLAEEISGGEGGLEGLKAREDSRRLEDRAALPSAPHAGAEDTLQSARQT